ncbi:MAG TPA: MGMT family protein [Candidatus Baltobacteraceae bacterium]|jgi:methylated-DNA-[protein]-cysteine S-methyltransferase
MRCRDVEALWDDIREGMPPLREAVLSHLKACPPCQELYEQYEGVAYCLSCLPQPEPSCDLAAKVVEHIAQIKHKYRSTPVTLAVVATPIGRLYVGFKDARITFVGIDRGEPAEAIREQVERRLRRNVQTGEAPSWLIGMLDEFFTTWHVDEGRVDISDLTPFEQAALKAAAAIPPGEVRSYSWVAREIGRPRAARAVGQAMARNPLPLLFPCHRVVDSNGELHNYGYGIEMKARILKMEGYKPN